MKKKKQSKFRKGVAANAAKQQAEASGASYGYLKIPNGVGIFKEPPGKRVYIDIVPYTVTEEKHPDRDEELEIATVGELWYKRPFKIHRNVGVDDDSLVCPTSIGKRCPICEYRAKRIKEGADKEETDAMKPSQRNLYLVVPRESKDFDEELHLWDISQYLFQKLLNKELEEDEDFAVFPDPDEGYTLKVRFDADSYGGNKFARASRIDFIEREPLEEEFAENDVDLDAVLQILSYEELEKKYFELDDEDVQKNEDKEEPEKEEEAPTRRRRRKIESEEEPEEKETEKPTRRRRKIEHDEEEPEETETEKPKPTRRRKKEETPDKPTTTVKCPFGHKFGVDTDAFDDCDDCDLWGECIDKKQE